MKQGGILHFLDHVAENEALQRELVELAVRHGFEFTADELSDAQLDAVAGGTEGDKVRGFFQGWQEKVNQVDQQLTSILRIMKDLGRVGIGGSDLGAS